MAILILFGNAGSRVGTGGLLDFGVPTFLSLISKHLKKAE